MAKGTVIFIFILCILAALLLGINLGKNISQQSRPKDDQPLAKTTDNQPFDTAQGKQPTISLTPSPSPSPTIFLTPTSLPFPTVSSKSKVKGISTYKYQTCGFQLTFSSSLSEKIESNQSVILSVILTNPDNPNDALIIVCNKTIPKPSVAAEKIEAVTMDKTAAILYHDQNPDGSPRDEIIVKNPNNNMEIIIAGYGETFQTALSTFRFL